jgi:Transposase DDE domain group 1
VDRRRPRGDRPGGVHQPDGPLRDERDELPDELTALADLSRRWVDRVQARRAATALVLDIDSSVSPTYGEQEGTAYNGHFECTGYHPLFVFN